MEMIKYLCRGGPNDGEMGECPIETTGLAMVSGKDDEELLIGYRRTEETLLVTLVIFEVIEGSESWIHHALAEDL